MKKILLTTVIASVALVSCVKEDATNLQNGAKQKITFDTPVLYGNENSRANVLGEVETYQTSEKFTIYAVSHTNEFIGWEAQGVAPAEFNNTIVSYDPTVNGWAPKQVGGDYYYWENGKMMSFAACSPADVNAISSYDEAGLEITDFEVPAVGEQYDLMFSERSLNKTSNDMTVGEEGYKGVQIKFQHALSSIRFALVNSYEKDVVLTDIEIKDVFNKGTFNENITEDPEDYIADPKWTLESTTANYVAFAGEATFPKIAKDATEWTAELVKDVMTSGSTCNQLLLMPQDLSEDAILLVHYTVDGKENTKEVALKGLKTKAATPAAIDSWEMGTRYTYILMYSQETAAKDKIYFAPEVAGWVDADQIIVNL